jgi:Trk K+ transport system NAD-binding subunit
VHQFVVQPGARAVGRRIADLDELPEDTWISFVIRDRGLVAIRGETELHTGDRVLVLGDEDCADRLKEVFEGTARE